MVNKKYKDRLFCLLFVHISKFAPFSEDAPCISKTLLLSSFVTIWYVPFGIVCSPFSTSTDLKVNSCFSKFSFSARVILSPSEPSPSTFNVRPLCAETI